MAFSSLAKTRAPLGKMPGGGTRYTKRPGKVDAFIVHHAAGTSLSGLLSQYVAAHRQLSSTYAIHNDQIIGILDEQYRPFTSSSSKADGRAVTVEVVNSTGAPGWEISNASFESLAQLIADVATRHGFPIDRNHVIGHREVLPKFGQGISTACPGGIWPRMNELVQRAREIQNSGSLVGRPATPESPANTPTRRLFMALTETDEHEILNTVRALRGDQLAGVKPADARADSATIRSIRESQVHPGGYTYDAAILGLLQTVVATLGKLNTGTPASVDIEALAEQLKATLGPSVADVLAKRLAS